MLQVTSSSVLFLYWQPTENDSSGLINLCPKVGSVAFEKLNVNPNAVCPHLKN